MVDPGYHMLYKGAIPISKTSHCVYAYRVSLNGESDTAVEPLGSRAYGLIPSTGTRITEYYIKWLGYDHSYDSWEPEANLHCPDLLKQFLQVQSNTRAVPTTSSLPSTRSWKRKCTHT